MTQVYRTSHSGGRKPPAPVRKPGNWKLAYADFLTALCALFLVMWIVHGTSQTDRQDLAQQFSKDAQTQVTSASTIDKTSALSVILKTHLAEADLDTRVSLTEYPNHIQLDLSDFIDTPLFETGDGLLNKSGEDLVATVGQLLSALPQTLAIEGHTDSNPIVGKTYTNWELSSQRAHAARRLLLENGVDAARIQAVTGRADTSPLDERFPDLPANRRISILVLIGQGGV